MTYHGKPGLGSTPRPSVAKLDPILGEVLLPNGTKLKDADPNKLNTRLREAGVPVTPEMGFESTCRAYADFLQQLGNFAAVAAVNKWRRSKVTREEEESSNG